MNFNSEKSCAWILLLNSFLGGPLTTEIKPGRRVVVGVVSFGHASGCTLGKSLVSYSRNLNGFVYF